MTSTTTDDAYRYCPHCAETLQAFDDGERWRQRCPRCAWIHYRNPTAGVAVVLLTEAGLWLGRRRSGGWCIPCGHVEWDETIEEAVVREAREEMGIEVEPAEVFAVHSNFHNPHQHTVGTWFLCQASNLAEAHPGGDLEELRVFPLDEVPELVFPTDELVVQALIRRQTKTPEATIDPEV